MPEDKEMDWRFLHKAGATVRHTSPFSDIDVPARVNSLTRATAEKWVIPFYLEPLDAPEFISALKAVYHEIDDQLITDLLSEFNWRPRSVAARFAAIGRFEKHLHHVGKLLLRSDVCYAGADYCLALARFDSRDSVDYLTCYLDYYLSKADLWFDQGAAIGAIAYLDSRNGTDLLDRFVPAWEAFVANKQTWSLEKSIAWFSAQIGAVETVARAATTWTRA